MTTTWSSAPAGETWERIDPLLAVLARTLDAEAVPGGLHQVRWDPRHSARATYRARPVAGDDGDNPSRLVVLDVARDGSRRFLLPEDAELPGVVAALDPREVSVRLAGLCAGPVRGCRITPVSYRPGSRCVLRYDVATASGLRRFYVKLLAHGLRRCADVAAQLGGTARERGLHLLVPPVLAVWEDLGALVTAGVPGRNLSDVLADGARPAAERLGRAGELGEVLAAVHATPAGVVPAGPVGTPAGELTELQGYLPAAWHADPLAAVSLAALVRELSLAPPPDSADLLGHGAFRPGQVVAGARGLTLLDLDGACRADPARDAGNARAHLAWQGVRGRLDPALVPRVLDAFVTGYREAGGRLDPAALGWWQAAAMAKVAGRRYRSLAAAEWPRVPELLRAAHDALAGTGGARRGGSVPRPGLRRPDLLDPARMTEMLRPVLAAYGTGAGGATVVAAEPLGVARGRRAVVRYVVDGLAAAPVAVVAKAYAETGRAGSTFRNLVALAGGPFAGTPGLAVPVPLGVLPALGMVLYREAPGLPLPAVDAAARGDAVRQCARWLRALHGSAAVLDRHLDLDRELVSLQQWAAEIAHHDPTLRRPAEELADGLRVAAARLPRLPDAPLHKDFHPAHVLVAAEGGVTVIDLDEARTGDPALDVAHLGTYLEESEEAWGAAALAAFRDEYGDVPGPAPHQRLSFFAAYTRLKIAKQLVGGSGPLRRRPDLAGRHEPAHLLRRGSACLDA